jgi:glycerol kinase
MELVAAIDQGTTSTRCIIFDGNGGPVASHQVEHAQLLPRPGWVEHDPFEIVARAREAVAGALGRAGLAASDLLALGIANQRETLVAWDRSTGLPYANAIVWQDTRSAPVIEEIVRQGAADLVKAKTGLVPATYFTAGKLAWALRNVEGLSEGARRGRACAGTVDSWLLWNLTGGRDGPGGGLHCTDLTNASRTMLMDLRSGAWDPELCSLFGVPLEILPQIRPSSGYFGEAIFAGPGAQGAASAAKVPVLAVLGDQQAAMVGQVCFSPGETKSTYGTGNFLLSNTGPAVLGPANGLVATACYRFGGAEPAFALEGSVAATGSAVKWLRDELGLIASAAEVEALAAEVPDSGGVYFVPAFSGLFSPHWRPDARGTIVGLDGSATRAHLARAVLEAICFQTREVVVAMEEVLGQRFGQLKVDGGVTANSLCMQAQADILGIPVVKPAVAETTALGAASAAGCAAGLWAGEGELRQQWKEERRWEPEWPEDRRESAWAGWERALERSLGWV